MKKTCIITAALVASVEGFSFMPSSSARAPLYKQPKNFPVAPVSQRSSSSTLQMVDTNVIYGGAIAVGSFAAGIALVVFTENQGERGKARGGGVSDSMATKIAGKLMEDVEVSSVADVGTLATQLEDALKASKTLDDDTVKSMDLTEEEKRQKEEDADDGW